MATQIPIGDFTASERRTLAVVAMSIDDIDPSFRDEALNLIEKLATLDEVSQGALSDAIEVLAREKRTKELVGYLRSGRPLVDLQTEIFDAVDAL